MKKVLIFLVILNIVAIAIMGVMFATDTLVVSKSATVQASQNKGLSAQEIAEQTYHLESVTTNLSDRHYIRMGISLLADNPKTAEEIEARSFQINNYLIKEFSAKTIKQIADDNEVKQILENLKMYLNEQLSSGKVIDIYVTEKIFQ